jgi:hypothetical protein
MIQKNKIQKQNFPNGGFVLHKIPYGEGGKLSAWFDDNGGLLDVEYFLKSGKRYRATDNVKRIAQLSGYFWKNAQEC